VLHKRGSRGSECAQYFSSTAFHNGAANRDCTGCLIGANLLTVLMDGNFHPFLRFSTCFPATLLYVQQFTNRHLRRF
jgi:hypothetical protein